MRLRHVKLALTALSSILRPSPSIKGVGRVLQSWRKRSSADATFALGRREEFGACLARSLPECLYCPHLAHALPEKTLNGDTLCVVGRRLFGILPDVDGIRAVCQPREISVVEDAAQGVAGTGGD